MTSVPYDVLEAMVQCFGKSFYIKDAMAAFLSSAGVPRCQIDQYRHEPKFVWARHVLSDLGRTEEGCVLQRKIPSSLCGLRNVPDPKVPDRDNALAALRGLKELAQDLDLVARETAQKSDDRRRMAEERARQVSDRATRLEGLRRSFTEAFMNADRQRAGYMLQDLLQELFGLFEIDYHTSFRTPGNVQEIDGHFHFQGFDYLIEAKWRADQPTDGEIGSFKHKVDGKFESTRGLFVSVSGFRPEVIEGFNGRGSNILLMDGTDLMHVLEGRTDLSDGLRAKIEGAAKYGVAYTPMVG